MLFAAIRFDILAPFLILPAQRTSLHGPMKLATPFDASLSLKVYVYLAAIFLSIPIIWQKHLK